MAGTAGSQGTLCVYFNQTVASAGPQQTYKMSRPGVVSRVSTTTKVIDAGGDSFTLLRTRAGVDTTITIFVPTQVVGAVSTAVNLQNQSLLEGDLIRFQLNSGIAVYDFFVTITPPVAGLVAIP